MNANTRNLAWSVVTIAGALFATACKKDKDSKTSGKDGGKVTTEFQASRIDKTALARASLALSPGGSPETLALAPNEAIGRSEGAELESYSFRLSSVSFCGKLTTNGTGTSCQGGGFWSLYNETADARDDYDNYLPEQATADKTHFTDFLKPDALTNLSKSTTYTDTNVQSYDSVLVNWYRPFKVKASMTLSNGTKIYTKANGDFKSNGKSGLSINFENRVTDMTTGPAEEGTFFLPNGGTYFRLQTPFAITQADIESKTNFKVVFAFDPDGIIKGSGYQDTTNNDYVSGMVDPANGFQIQAPFLQIAPVVARENETIMREVYLLRSADSSHDVRVSLFYVKEDSDKAVRAVTTTFLPNHANVTAMVISSVDNVTVATDGSLTLKDWMGANVVAGLHRTTTPAAISGTVSHEECPSGATITNDGCSSPFVTTSYTYSLVAIGEVSGSLTAGYEPPPPSPAPTP